MTRTQKWIVAFWVFIGVMCIWSVFDYNGKLNKQAEEHPQQTKFVFLHTNAAPVAPTAAHSDKADVEQVGYSVQMDTPSTGSFTCYVTLKNVGSMPATEVQICVRPYRGASNYDEDVGHQNPNGISDDDPLAKFSDWLSFPDLAPGESMTRSIVFSLQAPIKPGKNPKPQIVFSSDKNGPKTPRPPDPTDPKPASTPAPSTTPDKHHSADN
jgi:hypothetical protein